MLRFAKRLLLILILAGIGLLALFTLTNYSEGERAGSITKLSKKGIIFKTWEGSIDMGIYQGARPNKGSVENTIWDFSVANDDIAKQIQEANARGNRVVLHFKEKYMKLFWVGETKYIVTAVEEVKNNDYGAPPAQQEVKGQSPATPVGGTESL